MAIFGYSRVSTPHQAESQISLSDQRRRIGHRVAEHGWTLDEMFVDKAVSGSMSWRQRPAGKQLLTRLQRGDKIFITKLDRAFRSALDALDVIEDFKARPIALYILDLGDGGDVCAQGSAGKLLLTVLAAVAQLERSLTVERNRNTRAHLIASNKFVGGKCPPLGKRITDDKTLVDDPSGQAAHRLILAGAQYGMSTRAIAKLVTKTHGIPISHMRVQRILRNQATPA